MTEQLTTNDNPIERLANIKKDILEEGPTANQEEEIEKIRFELGMPDGLPQFLTSYFSKNRRTYRMLHPRDIPVESRETESKFEKLIERVDEFYVAFYKREKNRCRAFLTEIEIARNSTHIRIEILGYIYRDSNNLYNRTFT
jgi:hypothetical protein